MNSQNPLEQPVMYVGNNPEVFQPTNVLPEPVMQQPETAAPQQGLRAKAVLVGGSLALSAVLLTGVTITVDHAKDAAHQKYLQQNSRIVIL